VHGAEKGGCLNLKVGLQCLAESGKYKTRPKVFLPHSFKHTSPKLDKRYYLSPINNAILCH